MTKTRRSFSPEFKREAVRLAAERGNLAATARELGLSLNLLRRWRDALVAHPDRAFPGHGTPRDEELARLQRELRQAREENEILKKAVGIISSRPR